MKSVLRFLITLFTILCCTTISGASIPVSQEGIVFEKACILEGGIGFFDGFIAPKSTVWSRNPLQRGVDIEDALAATDYKGWFRAGQLNNGYFPLVDFQKGRNLVSLKSVNTTGKSWTGRMEDHIRDLSLGHTVDGKAANMILDMRVQSGGAKAAESLIGFGSKRGVTVRVIEYP